MHIKNLTGYFFILISLFFFPTLSLASTNISGTLVGETTWTLADSPYILSGAITIPSGSTLTILPGTTITLNPGATLSASGTISALGSAQNPILFTSTQPNSAYWSLNIRSNGSGTFGYTNFTDLARITIDDATAHFNNSDIVSFYGILAINTADVTLEHYHIHNVYSNALEGDTNSSITATHGIISHINTQNTSGAHYGIVLSIGARGDFTDLTLTNCICTRGIIAQSGATLSLASTSISHITGGSALYLSHASSTISDLNISNAAYGITSVSSTLTIASSTMSALTSSALYSIQSTTTATDFTLTNTRSGIIASASSLTINGATFSNIYGEYGVSLADSVLHMTNSIFENSPYAFYGILVQSGTPSLILASSSITGFTRGTGIYTDNAQVTISDSTISQNATGLHVFRGTATIDHSSIFNNTSHGIRNSGTSTVYATNNWWGSATGPTHVTNATGTGDRVSDDVTYTPWLAQPPSTTTTPTCVTECYSNVLFLPGIKGSRLYRSGDCGQASTTECRLWEPRSDALAQELSSTPSGESTNPNIYTRDAIDTGYKENFIFTGDIYASFLEQMNGLVTARKINAFESIPYDWRLSYEDILAKGKKSGENISYNDATSSPYIIQELKRLAAESKTGKVTIVAHSTGGLLTKMLTNALGADASQLIDRVIFVDVPQTGTPNGIFAMLYGYDQALPHEIYQGYISTTVARDLTLHYPSAYNLLPSNQYFADVYGGVIDFSNDPELNIWRNECGNSINTTARLRCILTSQTGRDSLIQAGILKVPPVLVGTLFDNAQSLHDTTLDTWVPPTGVTLTQIAGWGIPTTVASTTLQIYRGSQCLDPFASSCEGQLTIDALLPVYHFTVDGSGTVVTPSALATQASGGRFWVNLGDYNFFHIDREHGDILEVPQLREFIQNLITNTIAPLPEYITTVSPESSKSRLRYTLQSPLTFDAYDNEGRHTGISTTTGAIEEQIPGSYFFQAGEFKYLFTTASSSVRIVMDGYASSTFSLDVEELMGDTVVASTTWKNMPVTPDTLVTLTTLSDITTLSPLMIDKNSDGIIDYNIVSKPNDVVTFPKPQLTVTADNKTITLGSTIPTLTAILTGFVNTDTVYTSVTGSPSCTTTATSTSPVGTYPITCTLGTLTSSVYDITTFATGTLTITYRFDGFLQPINDTTYNPTQSLSVFKGGSTVPVKFQLKDTNGTPLQSASAPFWLTPQQLSPLSTTVSELLYTDTASTGSTFRYDLTSAQYIYNWSTKSLTPGYWYRLSALLSDGTIRSVVVGVR